MLANIGAAAQMDLSSLRDGDPDGNPYTFDENEGEGPDAGLYCRTDSSVLYFNGSGVSYTSIKPIPKYFTKDVSCP